MRESETALNFWRSREHYPDYPNTLQRRFIDTNFIINRISGLKSILDLGCGDGAMLLALREFTELEHFYGYDVSAELLSKLSRRWGDWQGLTAEVVDIVQLTSLPATDVVISMGMFPYVFEEAQLLHLLEIINSDLLIVRTPCTLKKEDECINKYSEDLGANYAAIYRTVENCKSILSQKFEVTQIDRSYPNEIESKYDTKQFFFVCKKRGH